VTFEELLKKFWEGHNPTQGMRQGNDVGSQYRSTIYTTTPAQLETAQASKDRYQVNLGGSGYGAITTEIEEAGPFYYAEGYHQQYLGKNPNGYCPDHGTGVACTIETGVKES
jgi:peptide-methionine (S)-S-oxide reductase